MVGAVELHPCLKVDERPTAPLYGVKFHSSEQSFSPSFLSGQQPYSVAAAVPNHYTLV